jgi:hypothetical protein
VRSAQLLFLLTQDRWFALRRARSQLQVQRRLREISSSTSPFIFWIELIKTGASRYFARIDNILTRKFVPAVVIQDGAERSEEELQAISLLECLHNVKGMPRAWPIISNARHSSPSHSATFEAMAAWSGRACLAIVCHSARTARTWIVPLRSFVQRPLNCA